MFSVEYFAQWPTFFPDQRLERPYPTFDGRCICYPADKILRDYCSWRQADCHINNLYNTTFWSMVLQGGQSTTDAEAELKGTVAADKHEILFSRFGINYNEEPAMYRKGTVVYRAYGNAGEDDGTNGDGSGGKQASSTSKTQVDKERKRKMKAKIAVEHVDIIGNAFWEARPYILASR